METSETKSNKNGDGKAGTETPPAPKEPTASEIAKAVSKLVAELEGWPPGAQQRVLHATATTLGNQRAPEKRPEAPRQNSGGGNRR